MTQKMKMRCQGRFMGISW